eukprot:TRINITY_DN1175_c0_g1_i7.p1 TRINITY_DN1175_c0_g1~~TRINITY_DN1175_c0_g1_i7.p1  ORF type:complete len:384 (+),score=57.47 TRINITY_DN1175_c0_g1_i7:48-1199(+)
MSSKHSHLSTRDQFRSEVNESHRVVWLEQNPDKDQISLLLSSSQSILELGFQQQLKQLWLSPNCIVDLTTLTKESTIDNTILQLIRCESRVDHYWIARRDDTEVPLLWSDSLEIERCFTSNQSNAWFRIHEKDQRTQRVSVLFREKSTKKEFPFFHSGGDWVLRRIPVMKTTVRGTRFESKPSTPKIAVEKPLEKDSSRSKPSSLPPKKIREPASESPIPQETPRQKKQDKQEQAQPKQSAMWEVLSANSQELQGDCTICLESFFAETSVKMLRCPHIFHESCIKQSMNFSPRCPICKKEYGVIRGNQPKSGTMRHREMDYSLEGYPNARTIEILYQFPDGIQGPEHPSPGQPYTGTTRSCFLPCTPEGKMVLEMLKVSRPAR